MRDLRKDLELCNQRAIAAEKKVEKLYNLVAEVYAVLEMQGHPLLDVIEKELEGLKWIEP